MNKHFLLRSNFAVIVGMFALGFDNFLMAAILPEISHTLNSSVPMTSYGISIYDIAYIFAGPIYFKLQPKGKIHHHLALAISIFILGTIATFLSQSLSSFLFSRLLAGVGASLWTPLAVTFFLNSASSAKEGQALGQIWGAQSLGSFVGIPLSLTLLQFSMWQSSYVIIGSLGLIAFLILSLNSKTVSTADKQKLSAHTYGYTPNSWFLWIVALLTATASLGLYSFIEELPLLRQNSFFALSLYWAAGGLVGNYFLGPLFDRWENAHLILLLLQLLLLLFLFSNLASLRNETIQILFIFTWGVLGWSMMIPLQSLLLENQSKHTSIIISLFGTTMALGSGLGTAINAWLLQEHCPTSYLPRVATLELALALFFLIMHRFRLSLKCLKRTFHV